MNDVNFKDSSKDVIAEDNTTCEETFQTMNESFENHDYLIMSQKVLVGGIFFYLFYKLFKKK